MLQCLVISYTIANVLVLDLSRTLMAAICSIINWGCWVKGFRGSIQGGLRSHGSSLDILGRMLCKGHKVRGRLSSFKGTCIHHFKGTRIHHSGQEFSAICRIVRFIKHFGAHFILKVFFLICIFHRFCKNSTFTHFNLQ